jgi:hypothetical protein
MGKGDRAPPRKIPNFARTPAYSGSFRLLTQSHPGSTIV